MSVNIDFSYIIDGFYNSVNYYRSESPMDINSMPSPIETNITGLSYRDDSAEKGKTYYIRFGSVRGGVEKISNEVKLKASPNLVELPLTNDLIDIGSIGLNWISNGSISFSSKGAFFGSSFLNYIQANYPLNMNNNFKISFEFERTGDNNTYPLLFSNDSGLWSRGSCGLTVCGNYATSSFQNRILFSVSGSYDKESSILINSNQMYKIVIERIDSNISITVDDVVVLSFLNSATINVGSVLRIGCAEHNGNNGQYIGYIRNFIVYDVA